MAQQYPKDRFDVVPPELERVGAHRAPHARGRGLLWLVWCLVAILVIVGAGWIYLRVLDQGLFGASPSPQPTVTETASGSPSSSASATPSPTPTPTATVAPSVSVSVLNGARVAGLAAKKAQVLQSAGWTSVTTGNASAAATTTIYYADDSLKGAALGVAQSLGLGTVTQSDQFASGGAQIVVVLGTDAAG